MFRDIVSRGHLAMKIQALILSVFCMLVCVAAYKQVSAPVFEPPQCVIWVTTDAAGHITDYGCQEGQVANCETGKTCRKYASGHEGDETEWYEVACRCCTAGVNPPTNCTLPPNRCYGTVLHTPTLGLVLICSSGTGCTSPQSCPVSGNQPLPVNVTAHVACKCGP